MKFIYFVCALAVFIAGASAQTSCAARKMHADILSIRDQWADEISTLNTCTLDKLHQSMECYLKSYISQRDQLKSLMQGFSVDTNFTVNYQLLTLNSHIKAVQLDLDEGITRNRFKESSSRNFDLNMESALVNFETMEKAADGNPGLAKCWNDFRDECVALHKKIFVEENPGIFAKNINELSEKLQVIVKEADANVAKITHDLCACKGDGASACINQYFDDHIDAIANNYADVRMNFNEAINSAVTSNEAQLDYNSKATSPELRAMLRSIGYCTTDPKDSCEKFVGKIKPKRKVNSNHH